MKQSPILEFESSAFGISPGEDKKTNPGIYGKALAEWLTQQLRGVGYPAGEVLAEDFGWCVPIRSHPHSLYVVCASAGNGPNRWRVFAFAEGGIVARLLGKDRSKESLDALFTAVRQALRSASTIRGIRELEG